MRACKIDDMDVIANTCAVGRLIVGSVNFDIRALTERDLQHGGNQMCLRPMIFAEVLRGAGRIEVTQ